MLHLENISVLHWQPFAAWLTAWSLTREGTAQRLWQGTGNQDSWGSTPGSDADPPRGLKQVTEDLMFRGAEHPQLRVKPLKAPLKIRP